MRRLLLATALILSPALSGCKDKAAAPAPAPAPTPTPTESVAAPAQPATNEVSPESIRLEPKSLKGMGITAAFIADTPVRELPLGTAQSAQQQLGPVFISVWKGPDSTIENWRLGFLNRPGIQMSEPEEVDICGQKGIRQSAIVPGVPGGASAGKSMKSIPLNESKTVADAVKAESPIPANTAPSGVSKGSPSRTIVMVALSTGVGGMTFGWSIHTDKREAFKMHETAFFESIRCD